MRKIKKKDLKQMTSSEAAPDFLNAKIAKARTQRSQSKPSELRALCDLRVKIQNPTTRDQKERPVPTRTEFSGHLSLHAEVRDDDQTFLARQSFKAPFHLSKPYWDGHTLIVQVVNPTAGILSGDRLNSEITVGSGAAALITSPSATRIFKMNEGEAVSSQHFKVERGGWLEFMPEPLVPHHGSRFRQRTEIDLAVGGELFFADLLMPGRIARGETWAWERLCLELTLHVAGELILRERLDQSGPELKALAELAGAGDGACFANVVFVSPRLEPIAGWREALVGLHGEGVWVGLSRLRGDSGGWSLKLIAPDNVALRKTLKRVRQILVGALPRLASDPRKL
jgi:urease accessory protein